MSYMESKCGMVGYGIYIPEGRITARELEVISGIPENRIIEKIGIRNRVVGGKGDHCVSMAIESAKDCLKWKIILPDFDTFKKNLREKSLDAFLKVARDAMNMSRVKPREVDYVSMVHVKRESHETILKALGFNTDMSNYLEDYGHIGHVDNILSLELGLQNNQVKDGSNVLMITGGLGYSFAATLIKWGEC